MHGGLILELIAYLVDKLFYSLTPVTISNFVVVVVSVLFYLFLVCLLLVARL